MHDGPRLPGGDHYLTNVQDVGGFHERPSVKVGEPLGQSITPRVTARTPAGR